MQQHNPHPHRPFVRKTNLRKTGFRLLATPLTAIGGGLTVVALLAGLGWPGPSVARAGKVAATQPADPAASDDAASGPAASGPAPAVASNAGGAADLATAEEQILTIFQEKCTACHGPQLAKPKKFGYCLDLKRMAASPKLVVPLNPAKSKLYSSIEEDDMPPEDAKTGPLSPEQKKVVLAALKTWISAGAPAPSAGAQSPITAASGRRTEEATTGVNLPFGKRLLRLIGKFHPLLAHFPIALLVAAAVAELVWLRTKQHWLTGAVRFCTLFGAVGAFVTAALGWADAIWHSADPLLTYHRWLGTAAAVWAIPVVLLSEHGFRRRRNLPPDETGDPRPWFQVMLFAGVVLVGVAAHFGGDLVYGADYLNW